MKGPVLDKPAAAHPRKLQRGRAAQPYLWMLSGSLAFAVMATLAHTLRAHCDWQVIAIARTALALVFAAGLARAAGARLVFWRPRILWVRSIAGSISLIGTFYAFTRLPVSDVLTLTSLFPIWVALLSWPLLKERPTGSVWLSVASSTVGVALVQQPHFAEGNFATLVALGASFFTAVALMGLHQLQHIDVRAIVVHFSGVSLLFCLAALCLFEGRYTPASALNGYPLLMLLGVGVTATVGQLFLTKAFAAGPPAKVSVVGLTQIVFVMVLEVLLTDRSFSPATLLGIALVMAPTAWLMVKSGAPEF
jgi:drug/metabolite transporter (DMT)-like permease